MASGGGFDVIQTALAQKCVLFIVFSHCTLYFHFDLSHIGLLFEAIADFPSAHIMASFNVISKTLHSDSNSTYTFIRTFP